MESEKKYITLADASLGTPYSQEYLSLLARKGKLLCKKIGRNWFTTREDIEEYIRLQQKLLIQEITQKQNLTKDSRNAGFWDTPVIQQSGNIRSDILSDKEYKGFLKRIDAKIYSRIRSDVATYALAIILFFGMGNFLINYSHSRSLLGAIEQTQKNISTFNLYSATGFDYFDSFANSIFQWVDSLHNNFSRIAETIGQEIISLFPYRPQQISFMQSSFSEKTILQSDIEQKKVIQNVEPQEFFPPPSLISKEIISGNNVISQEQIRGVTQVREIVERKESIIPVNLALLKQEFLMNIDAANKIIRDRFDDAISRLQVSLARTSGRTESSINMVSLSQKIDALNNLLVTNGMTLDSGNLDVMKGSIVVSSGGVNLSAGNLIIDKGSVLIMGTATSSWSDAGLAVGGGGLATSRGLTISGGSLLNQSSATSSFANGIQLTAGCFRLSDGICAGGGGSGTPGGSDTQVQFNDGSVFNGDSAFTWDKNTNVLTITGGFITTVATSTSATTTELRITNSAQIASSTIGGQLTIGFLNATSSTVTSTINDSLIIALTNQGNVRIGTSTTPADWKLQIASTSPFLTLTDTDAALNQKHWTLSSNSGSFFIASATDAYATTSKITALTITNGGNFGIASTTPYGQFSIEAGTNPYPLWIGDMGTSSPYFVVRSNGTVGIGTSSPSRFFSGTGTTTGNFASSTYLFSVAGGVYLDSNIITIGSSSASLLTVNYQAKATTTIADNQPEAWTIATSTTATPLLRFNTTAGQRATTSIRGGFDVDAGAFEYDSSSGVTSIDSLNAGPLRFDTDAGMVSWIDLPSSTSTPRVSIVNSYTAQIGGNSLLTLYSETTPTAGVVSTTTVGIGTTTPQWTLQIASTSPFLTLTDTDAVLNQKHWTLSSNSGNFFIASATDAYATTSFPMLTITNGGNVGIGTTSPVAEFAIEQLKNSNYLFWIGDQGTANASSTAMLSVTGAGNVGIGTSTTPKNWAFQIASTSPFLTLTDTDATKDFKHWTLSSNSGNFYLATASDAYATATIPAFTIATSGSTTIASILNVGGSGTSTITGSLRVASSTATSTFVGNIATNLLNVTSSSASSTFAGGIVVAGGVKVSTYDCSVGYANSGKLTTDANGFLTCANDNGGSLGGNNTAVQFNNAGSFGGDETTFSWDNTNKRLGIGTSSPMAQLSIDTDTNPYAIWVGDKGGANASTTPFFAITGSGQILIGTTTGTSTPQPNWTVQIASTSPFLTLTDTDAVLNQKHWTLSSNSGNFFIASATDAYATTSFPMLTITNGGNVGIGTTSPVAEFAIEQLKNSNYLFWIGDQGTANASSTAMLSVTGAGNVGIGTSTTPKNWAFQIASTSPFLTLTDTDATLNQKHWTLSSNSGNFFIASATDAYATGTAFSALTITSSGDFGIGTVTPATTFSVNGSILAGSSTFASTTVNHLSVRNNATSTFVGGIQTDLLNVTSSSASSTFAGGVTIAGGVRLSTYNCASGYSGSGKLTTNTDGYLTCADDTGAGVGAPDGGAGAVQFTTNGTTFAGDNTTFVWDNTAKRLGIGTSSPSAKLSLEIDNEKYPFWIGNQGSTSPAFVVDNGGRVGIGTPATTSYWSLQIASTSPTIALIYTGNLEGSIGNRARQWTISNQSGSLFFASSTDGIATSSKALFSLMASGTAVFQGNLRVADLKRCNNISTNSEGVFECANQTSNVGMFWDTTADAPVSWTTATDVWDGTYPNITIRNASSTVLVVVSVGAKADEQNDQIPGFEVHRNTNADPSCTTTGIGSFFGTWETNTGRPLAANGSFIDMSTSTPFAVGDNVRYTVCTGGGLDDGDVNTIQVQLVELGADVAENYYTKDTSITSGDVVAVDGSLPAGIKKTAGAYDARAIGVVSTMPYMVLDDAMGIGKGRAVPVALVGRIPVKVSTENGRVRAGDYLTSSSLPGVAMKATKAGPIIGQALGDFSYADGSIGLVVTFVKNAYYTGDRLIQQESGLAVEGDMAAGKNALSDLDRSRELLTKLVAQASLFGATSTVSEIFTDRLAAGLEIITPRVVARELVADTLVGLDGGLRFELGEGSALSIVRRLATSTDETLLSSSTPVISFDSLGNAFFAGGIRAESVSANKISGFEILTDKISSLSDELLRVATATPAEIFEKLAHGIDVGGPAVFGGATSFATTTEFLGDIRGNGGLVVNGLAEFNGVLRAREIEADHIRSPGLEVLTREVDNLKQLATTTANFEARLGLLENAPKIDLDILLSSSSGLEISGTMVLNGGLRVDKIGAVSDFIKLTSDVDFIGRPYFNADTGGFAEMKKGARSVAVVFEREYLEEPVVNATIALGGSSSTPTDALEQLLFDQDIRFLVTKKTVKGFTIVINKPAPENIRFSWIALAIKNAKVFESLQDEDVNGGGETILDLKDSLFPPPPSPQPSPIPPPPPPSPESSTSTSPPLSDGETATTSASSSLLSDSQNSSSEVTTSSEVVSPRVSSDPPSDSLGVATSSESL